MRHAFVAALPIALLLLATVAVALLGRGALAAALWWAGCLAQLFATVWVLARWWRGSVAGGLIWAGVTPALFIPVVGNVLAPLAGVPLGQSEWSAALFGVGLLFWPVVLTLRLGSAGGPMAVLGPLLLSLASLVVLWLSMATLRGLRDGSLLAPEPVAPIVPVQG